MSRIFEIHTMVFAPIDLTTTVAMGCMGYVQKDQPKASPTCCEGVAGIQTHSHSGLVSHFVYDALQLGECATHRTALTAHVLQH